MDSKNNFDEFNNFQIARQTSFRSFFKFYRETKDSEESLQEALETAKFLNKKLQLTTNYYRGLQGEIIFFGKQYKALNLDPLVEIGDTHADFHSHITNQYYDVTTNMKYKDISDYIRNDSKECMIAYVDINSKDIELIPTVFEHCPNCGNCLHFVYALSNDFLFKSLLGIEYRSQDLYKCCSSCDFVEYVDSSSYMINSPADALESLFGSRDEDTPKAKKYLQEKFTQIASLGRKHFDTFISAVACPETVMGCNKDDIYETGRTKWINPILDLTKNPYRKIYFEEDVSQFLY